MRLRVILDVDILVVLWRSRISSFLVLLVNNLHFLPTAFVCLFFVCHNLVAGDVPQPIRRYRLKKRESPHFFELYVGVFSII